MPGIPSYPFAGKLPFTFYSRVWLSRDGSLDSLSHFAFPILSSDTGLLFLRRLSKLNVLDVSLEG